MSEDNDILLEPVEAFTSMFKNHLEKSQGNLLINNFILLRNVLKQAAKDSFFEEPELLRLRNIEELWQGLNKGCSCTKAKRTKDVSEGTSQFILSEGGKAMLAKVKGAYLLNSLKVDIPEPRIECDI